MSPERFFERPAFLPTFTDFGCFRGKCAGITGHRGVLGSIVLDRLSRHGVRIEAYPGDVTDAVALAAWFSGKRFDYFYHFAAVVPVTRVMGEPLRAYDVNVIGTYNVCRQIIQGQPGCWLFLASSSHVYQGRRIGSAGAPAAHGEPDTFYGKTKLAAERAARPILDRCGVDYCIGRIFSFSGPTQREPYLVPTLIRKIGETAPGGQLRIINPDSVRDIMDADTVIDGVLHLAKNRFRGTLDIGSGTGLSVKQIAERLSDLLGKKTCVEGTNESEPTALVADVAALRRVLRPGAEE